MKKILCILLTTIMLITSFSLTTFAEKLNKLYTYDNYTIKYNIENSWGNNQNVSITISNISNEPIENWMLAYDFCRKTTLTY